MIKAMNDKNGMNEAQNLQKGKLCFRGTYFGGMEQFWGILFMTEVIKSEGHIYL